MDSEGRGRLTFGEGIELFSNPYRRRLLLTLLEHNPEDEAAIPDDLATTDDELESMLVEMTHTHLPKLESLGVVAWNREQNVVTRGPHFEELRPLLVLIDDHQDELPEGWL